MAIRNWFNFQNSLSSALDLLQLPDPDQAGMDRVLDDIEDTLRTMKVTDEESAIGDFYTLRELRYQISSRLCEYPQENTSDEYEEFLARVSRDLTCLTRKLFKPGSSCD